ncbi:MAG TPA: LysE family translocator [Actinoplanes sp.]|nr:LysE family translocator [Actinoplanes sp.]
MPVHLTAFVTTIALLAVLPGANNATITRQTLLGGRRSGLLAVAGSSIGILIWAVGAALGLSAALLADPGAYLVLRLGGAVLLCLLGIQPLLPARWTRSRRTESKSVSAAGHRDFAAGLATSLGNPKAGVVAVSLIPQFVTAGGPVLASSIMLGAIWAVISGTWFCLYVYGIDRSRSRWERPGMAGILRAATGVTMIGLGIAVAVGA